MIRTRGAAALLVALGVFAYAAGPAQAVDCVGPGDPPGCVTPSPTATPAPDPTPSATATLPTEVVVVLGAEQYEPLLFGVGVIACLSLVGVIGSWAR